MISIINPANESVIAELVADTAQSVEQKFREARLALPQWKKTSLAERCGIVNRFAALLQEHKEECARILSSEMGKPISQARNEIIATDKRIRFFVENVEACLQEEVVLKNQDWLEKITYDPLGVVANISAWNYPYFVGSNVFIPALLTGNVVLYKPSEFALLTGSKIADLLAQAGLPAGTFQTVLGAGDVGTHLLKTAVDGVFFTGSVATGRKIAAAVAPRFIRTGFELGGKDPAYVCDDVDIEKTAAALSDGAFYNAGQSCCAVERIYVHERVYTDFVEAFASCTKKFVVGDPLSEHTYIGPLARKTQLDFLTQQVVEAREKGAKLVVDGGTQKGKGWYFRPVVMTEVDHTMSLMREESFGPVVGIQKVQSDAEAVEKMQDTSYGLTASVYTCEGQRANRILATMDCGTVYWNACDRVSPILPWTGRKDSGHGSTLSKLGIKSFVQPKAWHMRSVL